MTPRVGESQDDFAARRRDYDKQRWRTVQRTLTGDGSVRSETQKPEPTIEPVAIDKRVISRTTTLYGADGKPQLQWVQEKPEDRDRLALWRAMADELAAPLPRVAPIAFDLTHGGTTDKLMACYPVGDHHLGMLSWRPETGASYDIEIGEKLLSDAFQYLIPLTPKCERAVIVFLGDFMHYDSREPVTPAHKHQLDADGRSQKMVRAAIRTMRRQIEMAALWHRHVLVIIEPGNHDPYSSVWIMEALHNIYEDNPRITIDTTPRPYHYFRFGRVLVGTHHGDLAKPEALAGIMAADRPEDWGATDHRYWWTGHIHSRHAEDFRGVSWESFRILPPPDAWAAHSGYRPIRDMKAIVLHQDHGEVARHTVNPKMLEGA